MAKVNKAPPPPNTPSTPDLKLTRRELYRLSPFTVRSAGKVNKAGAARQCDKCATFLQENVLKSVNKHE
jgi:hypothetical protein